MKISEMPDDEASALLLKAYRAACDAYDPDVHGDHVSRDVNRWIKIAASGGTNSEKEIQKDDDLGNGGNGGAVPAQDGRYVLDSAGVPRFEHADGRVIGGDTALEARSRQTSPSRVKRMTNSIAGYSRLK